MFQLKPNNVQVHSGGKQVKDGTAVSISLNDLLSEEERDIILEVEMPESALEGGETVVTASMTYLDVIEGQMRTEDVRFDVCRAAVVPEDINPDEKIAAHWARIQAGAAIREAVVVRLRE